MGLDFFDEDAPFAWYLFRELRIRGMVVVTGMRNDALLVVRLCNKAAARWERTQGIVVINFFASNGNDEFQRCLGEDLEVFATRMSKLLITRLEENQPQRGARLPHRRHAEVLELPESLEKQLRGVVHSFCLTDAVIDSYFKEVRSVCGNIDNGVIFDINASLHEMHSEDLLPNVWHDKWGIHVKLVGSAAEGTAVHGSDLNCVIVLNKTTCPIEVQNSSFVFGRVEVVEVFLERLWSCFWDGVRSLKKFYRIESINYDRACLTVSIKNFMVDLLPALVGPGGTLFMIAKTWSGYELRSSNFMYKSQKVEQFIEWPNFRDLIRLMKCVGLRSKFPRTKFLSSVYTALAVGLADDGDANEWRCMSLLELFQKCISKLRWHVENRIELNGNIVEMMDEERNKLMDEVRSFCDRFQNMSYEGLLGFLRR